MPLSCEEAQALIGQRFSVHTQQGTIELTLLEVQERPRRGLPQQFRTPLSLILSGPATLVLSQDQYVVEHPSLGRRQWMVVPTFPPLPSQPPAQAGADSTPLCYYEVLFS
jgi:hypothetical protein